MNKNRIEGAAKQGERGERAIYRQALVTKAKWRRCGGCAAKECVLTREYLALFLKGRRHGEAGPDTASDETGGTLHEHTDTGSAKPRAGTGGLLEAALTRQNLQTAWKRVKANRGAAGVDGLDTEHTACLLQTSWPDIRQALLAGS